MTSHTEYQALGTTPEQRQVAYRALFQAQLDPETLTTLRSALNGERITGSDRFKAEIETALGRKVESGQRGRPSKQVNANNPTEKTNGQLSFRERI